MRPLALVATLCLVTATATAGSGGSDAPPSRGDAQRGAKEALGQTRLDDSQVTAVHAELEKFASRWARHVRKVGPAAARAEDIREAVDDAIRPALYDRGVALSQQEALIDATTARAEAILRDYERIAQMQAAVKRALEDSGTEDPDLSRLFERILDLADDGHALVQASNAPGVERVPASELVATALAPAFEAAEVPERHVRKISQAVAQWLEARAAFEAEIRD